VHFCFGGGELSRINLEDSFWFDPRREYLIRLLDGDELRAIGACVKLWRLGQEYFKRDQKPIPESAFKFASLPDELFQAEFAERQADGIHVKGAQEHFGWLISKIENGRRGGVKSGISRSNKNNELTEANRSEREANRSDANPPTPSPPLPPSPTQEKNNKEIRVPARSLTLPAGANQKTWEAYAKVYAERYGTQPVRNASVNAMIANFVKRLGFEEAPQVIAFFVRSNQPFYVSRLHTVNLALKDAEKLRTEWATGRESRSTINKAEQIMADNRDMFDKIQRGEV
jgi:hypothetical protein